MATRLSVRTATDADDDVRRSRSLQQLLRAGASPYSTRYIAYVVGLLSIVGVLNYMDRTALSVLMPLIKKDLQLSDGQLGLLVGFAFFLFYATCGIPVARWADRGVRRNLIAIAIATWSVMTALSGVAQNFWQLLCARVGLGAAEAGCIPASQSVIADYVPLTRRSAVYGVYGLGAVVGMMLGLAAAGTLAELVGWRWTFVILGVPGVVLAVIVRLTLQEPPRGLSDTIKHDARPIALRQAIGILWRCSTYRRLTLYYIVNGFIQIGLTQWYPSFYARTFGLSSTSIGLYLGISMAVGSALGLVLGGLLSSYAAQRDVRLPFVIGAGALLLSLPTAAALLFVPSLSVSLALAALTGLLWYSPGGSAAAVLYSVVKPSMRATGGAITIFCTSVLGFGMGPFCVGVLSDVLAPLYGAQSLRYALLLPTCFVPVLAFVLHSVARDLRSDLQ